LVIKQKFEFKPLVNEGARSRGDEEIDVTLAQLTMQRPQICSDKMKDDADPKMKARLLDLGGTPMPVTPADFGRLIADEIEKWAKVVEFAGIRAE
jgi:tripartite-type tricarboxylate transporter receptor subunit TctC